MTERHWASIAVAALLGIPFVNHVASAQAPAAQRVAPTADHQAAIVKPGADPTLAWLRTRYQQQADSLRFVLADASSTPLVIEPQPVFTWASLGGWSGDVFAWTAKGRIQMIGCIGSRTIDPSTREYFHEFHSLADEPLKDTVMDASFVWRVPSDRVRPQVIPDAPPPGASETQRLFQMRRLAKEFTVGMQVTADEVERELRLLPNPLLRTSGGTDDVVDGALFTFVSSSGTDPELFLWIESRNMDQEYRWAYTVARFTTREIWLSHQGQEVWRVPAIDAWERSDRIHREYDYRPGARVRLPEPGSSANDD